MNKVKYYIGLVSLLVMSLASAQSPEDFAKTTMKDSLLKLKEFHAVGHKGKSIEDLIRKEFLPKIDQEKATGVVFSKYWDAFSKPQKEAARKYLIRSMLNDYSAMILSYKQENEVIFNILPKTKTKKGLAIVFAKIGVSPNDLLPIAFKLSSNEDSWKIYDMVIMGTSLLNTYKYMVKSKIKREGIDFVLQKG